ncbi:MAG TPA: ABC transporter ATP-binding protein [Dialister sp.]|nr:ABC transporter ATP-binding protein [Dialister sp.]
MEQVKDVSKLVFIKARGGRFRWLTISTLMLAIGMLLHLVSPSVAGFTPNWMIATYVVAILLTKPTYKQCLGICMVAALMEVFTSKSAFPYGDFASEFFGAYVAGFFAHAVPPIKIGKFSLRPAIAGFVTTLVSGFTFVSILTLVMGIPLKVYLYGMLPMVFFIGIGNGIITPFLYFPALRLFKSMHYMAESDVEDSDHSAYDLKQSQDGVISVEHLTYTYPFSTAPALKDVSLAAEKGDFFVITGPNGAGKTSLLMAMAGAIPHYYGGTMEGMVFTDGKAVTQHTIADLASSIGVILSDYKAQIVTMTVGEEMAFTLENHGFPPDEIRRRSKEALAKVHLDGLEERKVSTLSGGQCQRLVTAAVLAEEPQVLIFDEPTSALDPEGIREFYEMVGELNQKEGLTVIVAEHHLEAALPYANKFVLMNQGEIISQGTPEKVMRYMYDENVYQEAIPDMYKAQLELESVGISFDTPFLNIAEAEKSVVRSFEGGRNDA